ncbi:hypothetical protein V6Z12_D10G174200 [Gossypium hirsutum]|uniref:Uncharacterized protein n=1 Tax=Gossypium tomentosum TaxID=34277 RepID=A0A5D2J6W8_GOSTO|nr:hypothetical protein ES332_D10G187200v1 [Gossypium tomentosum]
MAPMGLFIVPLMIIKMLQAVVEFMADLVAKRDTKASPPKKEKGFWFRICSICWPFRTANTDNKICVCVFFLCQFHYFVNYL